MRKSNHSWIKNTNKTKLIISFFLILPVFSIIIFNPSPLYANKYFDWAYQQIEYYERNFKKLIKEKGDGKLNRIIREVNMRPERSRVVNAYIYIDQQNKVQIRITTQLFLVASYLSELKNISYLVIPSYNNDINNIFYQNDYGKCIIAYDNYLTETFRDISYSLANNQELPDVYPPENFAQLHAHICPKIRYHYPLNNLIKNRRGNDLFGVLIFFYLHELGHYKLNHLNNNTDNMNSNIKMVKDHFLEYQKMSREQEYEADRWAVDAMFDLNVEGYLLSPTTIEILIASSNGLYMLHENIDSHPHALHRVEKILLRFKDNIIQKNAVINPDILLLIDDLVKFTRKVEKNFPAMPGEALPEYLD